MDVYAKAREMLGGGELEVCKALLKGSGGKGEGFCDSCCDEGIHLMDGEELPDVPDGVTVVNGWVSGCLGKSGCKFEHSGKPLLCIMYPVVFCGVNVDTCEVFVIESTRVDKPDCPVLEEVPQWYREKVLEVIMMLMEAGLWNIFRGQTLVNITWERARHLQAKWAKRGENL